MTEIAVALGLAPKVLLLDEPAAGVPNAESHIILDAIDALPKSIGVLIEGTPGEIADDPRVRQVYLGERGHA